MANLVVYHCVCEAVGMRNQIIITYEPSTEMNVSDLMTKALPE
jgi:hypothetical protein